MRIAIVGCGWVADYYMTTLPGHPSLELVGTYDRDRARHDAFTRFYKAPAYESLEALLADPRVEMVLNLTNPRSHHEVSRAALLAGKHVYSEKPLAMTMAEAEELVALAAERGLGLAAAPCNHLAPPFERLADAMRAGELGRVMLAHAEMDDGLVPYREVGSWRSRSGALWPARDEFEVGCVMEHAGYQLGPLVTLLGPVRRVVATPTTVVPEKAAMVGAGECGPDTSWGALEFDGGVVARISLGIAAPHSRLLRLVGTAGFATVSDVWDNNARLLWSPTGPGLRERAARKAEVSLWRWLPGAQLGARWRVPRWPRRKHAPAMDFSRGPAQLADQIERGATGRMTAALALHVTEVTLALQSVLHAGQVQTMRTTI